NAAQTRPLASETAEAWFAPRGIGLSAWNANERQQIQLRRRFMLLGETLDSMRVWDIRRAVQALRATEPFRGAEIVVDAKGEMGVNALYAAVFERGLSRVELTDIPLSHRSGPDYLNVLRFLDIPQAVAMAAENTSILLVVRDANAWIYPPS